MSDFLKDSRNRIAILLLFFSVAVNGQILRDTSSLNLVKKNIDYIYNLRFDKASQVLKKLNEIYPEHPVIYLLKGMTTYWENYPLLPSSPSRELFEKDMHRCIDLCGQVHDTKDDAEYLLANLSARGMLLLFYSDNDMTMEVIPLATSSYQYIRRSFDYTSAYSDFYFFTGLYNYYREAYPEAYPVYKTMAFLFPKGDKSMGLKQLQIVAQNSILFKAESYSFLTYIYLSFENNVNQAYQYSKSLHELYPSNIDYLASYVKIILFVKNYNEAERLIKDSGENTNNSYFNAQIAIFNGILQEKKYHDYKLAEQYYTKGINGILAFGEYGNEFAAYGYFGLSRISGYYGKMKEKKEYNKKAFELAEFRNADFN